MAKKPTYEELQQRVRELEHEAVKRILTEDRIEHLNLVVRAIRNVNYLIIREKNRGRLLQGACGILIETRGFYNAWIALLDEAGGLVVSAEAGLGDAFLPMVENLRQGNLTSCGGRALSQSGVVVTADPTSACTDCPLAAAYGGRGAMTVRLEHGGKVYGLFSVSIPAEFTTDEEELSLFKEVADDVALALHNIELEEKQKRAEEALHQSEKRFRNLIENSLTGISITRDNRVVYQNPEQERLLGPLPRPVKLSDLESIHPDDVEKVTEFYQWLTAGEVRTLDTDFRLYVPGDVDGKRQTKWVYCRASSVEYGGKPAILCNLMDITRSKELEQLLKIQDKMTSLGRVAAGIAHEIRNPLSGINIYLSTLEKIYDKGESIDKVIEIIAQLKSASNKIESVIKRVMDFSKPGEPKLVRIDINEPISEAVNLSSVTLRKSGLKIEKALADDLPPCRADSQMIEEVILNLIINAAEAMINIDGVKKIEVMSSRENDRIVVRVSDSGPGVPSNLRDEIFDPFYSTKNGSTGMGLSLSHRIITDHGGSLSVSRSKWGGAEFRVELPTEKGSA